MRRSSPKPCHKNIQACASLNALVTIYYSAYADDNAMSNRVDPQCLIMPINAHLRMLPCVSSDTLPYPSRSMHALRHRFYRTGKPPARTHAPTHTHTCCERRGSKCLGDSPECELSLSKLQEQYPARRGSHSETSALSSEATGLSQIRRTIMLNSTSQAMLIPEGAGGGIPGPAADLFATSWRR